MSGDEFRPLILTLAMDRQTGEWLDELRTRHFPPERNHTGAHLTLFHALPGGKRARFEADLAECAAKTRSFDLRFPRILSSDRWVAIEVRSPELSGLQSELWEHWLAELTIQDKKRFHPHVTIQNKVEWRVARHTAETLQAAWEPTRLGRAIGLQLWEYLGGPWRALKTFEFRGLTKSSP